MAPPDWPEQLATGHLATFLVESVVIGRNEGQRLRACLESLRNIGCSAVYVDSGSTDGSVELAKSYGAEIVELDMSIPFSAARARNEGFKRLVEKSSSIQYVQFLDGDCLLDPTWIPKATTFLEAQPDFAVVCGRRRERFPESSIYNRLIDMEWNTRPGEAKACGGDALFRVAAFQEVNGYNPNVVAGEEPELCVRLRQHGWRIMRLDAEMTLHDAAMSRFIQWWKRTKRAGHAYACGVSLHGKAPEYHNVQQLRSALAWALGIPVLIASIAALSRGWGLLLFLIYPIQMARIARYRRQLGDSATDAWVYGFFCVLGKLPEALGVLKFHWEHLMGRRAKIMEYKGEGA